MLAEDWSGREKALGVETLVGLPGLGNIGSKVRDCCDEAVLTVENICPWVGVCY